MALDVVAEWEITPGQLKDKLNRGEEITIIDVREPHEWQIANLASYGARLIPLGQFPQRLNDIHPADDIVVHCKVGGRSAQASEVLQHAGYCLKQPWFSRRPMCSNLHTGAFATPIGRSLIYSSTWKI